MSPKHSMAQRRNAGLLQAAQVDVPVQLEQPKVDERHGASDAEWQAAIAIYGDHLLPLVDNYDAPMHERSKLDKPGKVPTQFVDGKVCGVPGWPWRPTTSQDHARWRPEHAFGMRTGGTPTGDDDSHFGGGGIAIDIDVDDPSIAKDIVAYLDMHAPETVVRTRPNSQRQVRIYSIKGEWRKRSFKVEGTCTVDANGKEKWSIVEMLGDKQFVALAGRHTSGARYEIDLSRAPAEIAGEQFEALWAGLVENFGAPGSDVRSGAGVKLDRPRSASDVNDPFVEVLHEAGAVLDVASDGKLFVECPLKALHSGDSGVSETAYMPKGMGGQDYRALTCAHQSCKGHGSLLRKLAEQHGVLEQLTEIERSEGRGPCLPSEFDHIELTAAEELAGREQQLRNAASPDAVIEYLRELRDAEPVLSKWVFLAGKMPQAGVHRVRDEVSHLTKVGVRDLNAMLRDEQVQAIDSRSTKKLQSTIRGRRVVIMDVTGWSVMAEQVEAEMTRRAAPGDYVAFAGLPSRITLKEPPYAHAIGDPKLAPPRVPAIEQLGRGPMLKLAEGAAVVVKTNARGGPRAVPVPSDVREQLLTMTERTAPVVKGLVSHALVLPHTGEIVSADGIHEASRLYFANAALDGARPYGQDEAREALGRLREAVLEGFEFASVLDGDVALAALFTGVQRKLLPEAPGVAVLAAAQSSGKTTLLRRLHVVLTGQDMPVQTLSDDSEEVGKRLLATLLQAPAMVVFDNLTDGLTFRSSALAAAITNPVFRQRVLGATQEIEAPTNVLFALTGNNLKFGADEVSRFLVCRLEPRSARPQERTFQHPDVVAHARAIRHDVLRDVVGIVAGHIKAGMKVGRGSRFGLWDDIVRQPLMWAGASDVAECFRQNENLSDAVQGVELLHRSLLALFGAERFTAASVTWKVLEAPYDGDDARVDLRSALLMLRAKDPTNESSAGRALGAAKGRASPVGRLLQPTVNGRAMYRMEAALD